MPTLVRTKQTKWDRLARAFIEDIYKERKIGDGKKAGSRVRPRFRWRSAAEIAATNARTQLFLALSASLQLRPRHRISSSLLLSEALSTGGILWVFRCRSKNANTLVQ